MDNNYLAELLFGDIKTTPEDMFAKYPARTLPDKAAVTRFAPSPTGFMHIGGLYAALISMCMARQSDGVFYLRLEDTDKKREIDLIGLEVRDADTGKVYGKVTDIYQHGAADVYELKTPDGKELMFPAIPEVLLEKNIDDGYLVIRPLDGLFDEE